MLTRLKYEDYANFTTTSNKGAAATATETGKKKKKGKSKNTAKAAGEKSGVSDAPQAPPGHEIVAEEERVEYRDQDGNLLDEAQVKELEGKVEFKTRYETRTRVVDADGNEVYVDVDPGEVQEVAPPHPDVEGVDPNTQKQQQVRLDDPIVGEAAASVEGEREREGKEARPASEGSEATQGEGQEKEGAKEKAHEEL